MLSVSPTTLDFGISTNSLSLLIANVGSGTLTWTITESPDKPWLTSITPSSGSGNATVTVTVDRAFLIGNSDTGTLAVTSNGGDVNVAVLISKPPVGSVVISAPNLAGASGTIDVPVDVIDLTGKNVVGLTIMVETQTSVLTPTSATTTGTILAAWGSVFINIVGGQITISGADVNPLSGSGTLITLQYQATCVGVGSTSPIHFVSAVLNEEDPPCITQDGSFTCAAGLNVSGKVLYHQNSNPVDNATITLDGYAETTAIDGSFAFTAIPGGNLTLTPTKDADLGNSISAFDASMILRYSVGLITLTPYQLLAADVSGNGSVSAYDASFILRYTVGLINLSRLETIGDLYQTVLPLI